MPPFIDLDTLNDTSFKLAIEAIVGTMAAGTFQPNNQEPVHDWVSAALGDDDPGGDYLAATMGVVSRVMQGPKPMR